MKNMILVRTVFEVVLLGGFCLLVTVRAVLVAFTCANVLVYTFTD